MKVPVDLLSAVVPPFMPERLDSPIERRFAHHAVKWLRPGLELISQVPISTFRGEYRLDFLIDTGTTRIAIECDGREYHGSPDQFIADRERDLAILATGYVDVIYRLPGRELLCRPEDCFYAMAHRNPDLLSPRTRLIIDQLASPEVRQAVVKTADWTPLRFRYRYVDDAADPPDARFFALIRRAATP